LHVDDLAVAKGDHLEPLLPSAVDADPFHSPTEYRMSSRSGLPSEIALGTAVDARL
jgi:hypothetical protein